MDRLENNYQTEIRDNYLILYLEGDITDSCEQIVLETYAEMERSQLASIILDFEKVRYVNSAGIAVFINLLTKMRQKQQHLYISNLSDYFRKIFTMIGLTRYSKYYPTVEEAIASIQGDHTT